MLNFLNPFWAYLSLKKMFFRLCLGICLGFAQPSQALDIDLATIDSMMSIFIEKKDYNKGLQYLKIETEKIKTVYGKLDTSYARVLYYTASLHHYKQNFDLAEKFYLKAFALQEQLLEYYHEHYAETLNDLAALYSETGNFQAALPLFQEVLEIDLQVLGKEHHYYSTSLNNLAVVYKNLNRFEEAEQMYKEAISIRASTVGKEHPSYAVSLGNLANLYSKQNKHEEAEQLYLQAVTIAKKHIKIIPEDYFSYLGSLAVTYTKVNQFQKAENLFKKILKEEERILGKHSILYATTLNNFASLYRDTKRYDQAEELYLQAAKIDSIQLGNNHIRSCIIFHNLFHCCFSAGKIDKAAFYLSKMLNIISSCNLTQKSLEEIIPLLPSCQYENISETIRTLQIISILITHYYQTTKKQKWLKLGYQATQNISLILDNFRATFFYEKDKLHLLKESNLLINRGIFFCYQLYIQTQDIKYINTGFQLAERNRAVVLMDALKTEQAKNFGNVPDSLIQEEKRLSNELMQLKKKQIETNDSNQLKLLETQINETHRAINSCTKHLEKHYPKYYNNQKTLKKINIKELQQKLEKKQALIEYFLTDTVLYFFICKQKSIDFGSSPIKIKQLNQNINQLHQSLSNYNLIIEQPNLAYQQYTQPAYALYLQLIKPLEKHLKDVQQLTIVPDDVLGSIPFEVLLDNAAPQDHINYGQLPYLLQKYYINYSYSSALLLENHRNHATRDNHQFLGMAAAYHYDIPQNIKGYRSINAQQLRKTLNELPNVRKEVAQLQKLVEGKFLFDSLTNEHTFKKIAPQYNIIHLAMHGLVNNQNPILSSLAFTENGDTTEDNFLYAYEISQMQLNAELVTLSACETGNGKYETGEGIFSLARAFMYAGVPSLVVSLWQVNDYSTSVLMRLFYENVAKDINIAKALQEAKKSYLLKAKESAQHPAFWAAFIQLGDSSPSHVRNKNTRMWGYFVLIGINLLIWSMLSRYLYKRRKLAKQKKS